MRDFGGENRERDHLKDLAVDGRILHVPCRIGWGVD